MAHHEEDRYKLQVDSEAHYAYEDMLLYLMQNEAWHCSAEMDMEFLGKVVVLMAAYVSPKFQYKCSHQWNLHI